MNGLTTMILAVLGLPLIGAIIAGVFGKFIGKGITHSIVIILIGIACGLSCYILYGFITGYLQVIDVTLYIWGQVGVKSLQIGLLVDLLSAVMLAIVSIISLVVHIYSVGYMKHDPSYYRFFSYIAFFTFAMLVLVVANNFLQLFFAWEMVGLASYLLIGFWFTKEVAVSAGFKAFFINRLSDFGFLLAILAIFYCYNSLNYSDILPVTSLASNQVIILFPGITCPAINIICCALLVGALGKSAQLPFHTWLPDSMAGPVPVSALIHAATMVTAGIFMITRVSPLFEASTIALNSMLIIGTLTCVAMGLVASIQYDIKQILAYSTISQLGLMLASLGVSSYVAGIFHLVAHAFFKSLLFLGAGTIILVCNNQQDLRKIGGLKQQLPFIYVVMLIASLAAVGFPGLSGFYSKDLILSAINGTNVVYAGVIYNVLLINIFVTALYTFRMFFLIFHGDYNHGDKDKSKLIPEKLSIWLKLPLIILAIPTLAIGWIIEDAGLVMLRGFMTVNFLLIILGISIAWLCCIRKPRLGSAAKKNLAPLYMLLTKKYWFEDINKMVVVASKRVGQICLKIGDKFIIERLLINGTLHLVNVGSRFLCGMQTGYLYHYILSVIIGLTILLYWVLSEFNRCF